MPHRKTRIGVLIHTTLRKQLFTVEDEARLDSLGMVSWTNEDAPITDAQAARLLSQCDIALGSWGTPKPTPDVLRSCSRLRLWVHAAGSVRSFFGPHLEDGQITIASCAPAIAENVAEYTTAQIIVGLKRMIPVANHQRTMLKRERPNNLKTLGSSTVAVVGASQVGRRVIRNVKAAGAQVMLYDPYVEDEEAEAMGAVLMRNLGKLCSAADVVTLHTPALPSTEKMMSTKQFRSMKDDGVFINTSRGSCVDEAALIAELQKGRLFAFLDVTDPEPPAMDSPLRTLPNVVYTPHIAGGADIKIGRQAVDDIEAYLAGHEPQMVVTREMLDRVA